MRSTIRSNDVELTRLPSAHRRFGYGTRAIRLFLGETVGGRRLVLEALNSNPIGQKFWRSLGMRVYSVTFELAGEVVT